MHGVDSAMWINTGNERGNVVIRASSITKSALYLASASRCVRYRNFEYCTLAR